MKYAALEATGATIRRRGHRGERRPRKEKKAKAFLRAPRRRHRPRCVETNKQLFFDRAVISSLCDRIACRRGNARAARGILINPGMPSREIINPRRLVRIKRYRSAARAHEETCRHFALSYRLFVSRAFCARVHRTRYRRR